jgi:hypothetical protein
LDLSENQIMLEELISFVGLEQVRLACNRIVHIEPLRSSVFTQLTELDLSYNALDPTAIESLVPLLRLESLNLSYNGLQEIPRALEKCVSITTLDLSFNAIADEEGLEALADMPKLRRLNLNNNGFVMRRNHGFTVDGAFTCLEALSLENNDCRSTSSCLPTLIGKVHFRTLRIHGNPCATEEKFIEFLRACTWETAQVYATVSNETNASVNQRGKPAVFNSDSLSHFVKTTTLPTMAQWRMHGLNSRFGQGTQFAPESENGKKLIYHVYVDV